MIFQYNTPDKDCGGRILDHAAHLLFPYVTCPADQGPVFEAFCIMFSAVESKATLSSVARELDAAVAAIRKPGIFTHRCSTHSGLLQSIPHRNLSPELTGGFSTGTCACFDHLARRVGEWDFTERSSSGVGDPRLRRI